MIALKINVTTNQKYYSQTPDDLLYETKTEDVYEDYSSDKKIFDFSNYSAKSKYYDNSNKLVIGEKKRWNRSCCDWRICLIETRDAFIHGRQ